MKNIKYIFTLILGVLILGTLCACGSSNTMKTKADTNVGTYDLAAEESLYSSDGVSSQTVANATGTTDEKLIHTYSLSVQSLNLSETLNVIRAKVSELNGYIENTDINSYEDSKYAYLTIRIPQSSSSDFVESIGENANIIHQGDMVENRTMDYIDYSAKVKALDDEIKRLEALADKAEVISDLLEIENNLSNLRAQKDSMQGQLNYIDDKVSFSTINMDISEVEYYDNDKPSIWKEIGERTSENNSEIRETVVEYVSAIPYMLVCLVLFLIPFSLIVFIVIRIFRFCRKPRVFKLKKDKDSEEI